MTPSAFLKNITNHTFILRMASAITLFMHSIPGLFDNGTNDFGNLYLNQIGFAPLGLYIAWAIKSSHMIGGVLLLINRYIKPVCLITIFILIAGIYLIHFKEGWYVVGRGRNGIEFNFLFICVLITIMYPDGLKKNSSMNIH